MEKVVKRQLLHRSGSEGPRYDPYHYDEYILHETYLDQSPLHPEIDLNWCYVLHDGLLCFFQEKCEGTIIREIKGDAAYEAWIKATGLTPAQTAKVLDRVWLQCPHCRSKKGYETHCGFPGETLYVCVSCGAVATSTMNWSEIE